MAALLELGESGHFTVDETQEMAERAADVFYGAPGSVTRALAQTCEEINRWILERNLDEGTMGERQMGSICLAVLHKDWLFICQYGPSAALLISSEKYEEFGKFDGQGETLGQSKHILPRFYQSEVKNGDLLLLISRMPSTWSSYYLAGSAALEMEQVRRRLLNQITTDIEAIVIKVGEGKPRVVAGDWQAVIYPEVETRELPIDPQVKPVEEDTLPIIEEEPDMPLPPIYLNGPREPQDAGGDLDLSTDEPADGAVQDTVLVMPGQLEREEAVEEGYEASQRNIPGKFVLSLARTWMNARTVSSKIRLSAGRLRKKFFPSSRPLVESFPPAFLTIIALSLPLALVLLSVSAYSRIGQQEQYDAYMAQAQETSNLARVEEDPVQQHAYWAQTLDAVRSAEQYRVSQDSRMLYEQSQFLLDDMDLATRLDFRPALTQFFPEGVRITRVQASSTGIYLLDETSGSILRVSLNSKGAYEIDDEFKCVPGPYGLETVSDLIDFIILPANPDNYRVMAIDADAHLLYCRPGETPVSRTLTAPPNDWGRIASAVFDGDVLYVLDAEKDALWMYAGKDPNQPDTQSAAGIVFSESPVKFLDENIPDLGGALDMVVNQQDVYILHEDGHMTICRYSPDKDVRLTDCQNPSPYTDDRVGRVDKKPWVFPDASLTMLQGTRIPNASIYILDVQGGSLYQFSYQLNLERVLRPQYNRSVPLPETPPSGFGVSPEMELFLAYDNKLYVAPLK